MGSDLHLRHKSHLLKKAHGTFWDLLARAMWRTGRILEGVGSAASTPFHRLSGSFDARADAAGWWDWHRPPTDLELYDEGQR